MLQESIEKIEYKLDHKMWLNKWVDTTLRRKALKFPNTIASYQTSHIDFRDMGFSIVRNINNLKEGKIQKVLDFKRKFKDNRLNTVKHVKIKISLSPRIKCVQKNKKGMSLEMPIYCSSLHFHEKKKVFALSFVSLSI